MKKNKKGWLLIGLVLGGAWPVSGQVFPGYPGLEVFGQKFFREFSQAARPGEVAVSEDYVLGPGDTLVINIWGFVEDDYRTQIDRDGGIALPRVGRIYPGGKRLADARKLIEEEFQRKYRNTQVSVTLGPLRSLNVFVLGAVRKPGSYEISPLFDILDILALAGGPAEQGSLRRIKITGKTRATVFVDLYPFLLEGAAPELLQFSTGDTVFVPLAEHLVGMEGAVRRPGVYEVEPDTSLAGLVKLAGGLLPTADPSLVQVERRNPEKGVVFIDLTPAEHSGFTLADYDMVHVRSLTESRFYQVSVEGLVKRPGYYGWKEGLRVSDILKENDLLPEAYREKAEIVRKKADGSREILTFSPGRLFSGDAGQNLVLCPQDRLIVQATTRPEKQVLVQGEVLFPGQYVLASGERISSVIERAGGFAPSAFLPGSVFLRESVRAQKELQLRRFIQEKTAALEKEAKRAEGQEEQVLVERGRTLLKQLSETEVRGRIVLKLDRLDKFRGSPADIVLEDGDVLFIPKPPVSVAIIGEVSQTTNILFRKNYRFQDYLVQAGDFTRDADRKNVFLVRQDGTATRNLSRLEPGDTIVVPFQAKERLGKIVRDIVQMMYQVSLSIASF